MSSSRPRAGDPDHPDWYKNLQVNPEVEVQIKGDTFRAATRTAGSQERPELWRLMTAAWPDYDEYTKKTDREIPIVVLEPVRSRLPAAPGARRDRSGQVRR